MTKAMEISKAQFDRLAEAAAVEGQFKSRNVMLGVEFSVWLNGHMMAKSTPDAKGKYRYEMLHVMPKDNQANACYALGRKAYANGINAAAQCAEWRELLIGKKAGEPSDVDAWNKGWESAKEENLRVTFPEMYNDT